MEPVFISYVHENKKLVDKLYQELIARGIEVWRDVQNLKPGSFWKEDIRKAIRKGAFFIACFSKEYDEHDETYMNEELTIAIEKLRQRHPNREWFIPIKLNECELPDIDIGRGKTLEDLTYVKLYENWDDGIQEIVKVISPKFYEPFNREPCNAEEYNKRGDARHSRGELDLAIKDYDMAIELEPDYHKAYNNRGNAYAEQQKFDRAINEYNIAIELDPEHSHPYNGRGNAYREKGDIDQAIKDYTKAIKLKPDYHTPYNGLGEAYRERGEFDKAIENYTKAIELKPDFGPPYTNLGIIHRKRGEFDKAIENYAKAIELEPNFPDPYNNRGNVYKDMSEFDKAY